MDYSLLTLCTCGGTKQDHERRHNDEYNTWYITGCQHPCCTCKEFIATTQNALDFKSYCSTPEGRAHKYIVGLSVPPNQRIDKFD